MPPARGSEAADVPPSLRPSAHFHRAVRSQAGQALCTSPETAGFGEALRPAWRSAREEGRVQRQPRPAEAERTGARKERKKAGQGPIRAMATHPIPLSKQTREVVAGIPTEVVCTAFGATILVVVTQYGKMGTLVSVEPDAVPDGISRPLWTTKVLLGKDEPLVHISAKHLVTSVSQEAGNKTVLLAMALKDKSIEGIRTLKELIHQCRVW